jgi:hypothetical protein
MVLAQNLLACSQRSGPVCITSPLHNFIFRRDQRAAGRLPVAAESPGVRTAATEEDAPAWPSSFFCIVWIYHPQVIFASSDANSASLRKYFGALFTSTSSVELSFLAYLLINVKRRLLYIDLHYLREMLLPCPQVQVKWMLGDSQRWIRS